VILVAILLIPLGAAIICAIPRFERLALALTSVACWVVFGLTVDAMNQVLRSGVLVAVPHWIEMDGFAVLMELIVAFVAATAALYSWGFVAATEREPRRIRAFSVSLNLFVASLLAVPLMVEPGAAWIAVGATTLFSVLLVSFENTREALEAAWKYMTITLVGATIALIGILMLFWGMSSVHGSDFTFAGLSTIASRMPIALVAVSFVFILVGFGAKVGLVPMHTWLPDAHSQAPSPICAMLSGVETSVALYVILRLLPVFRTHTSLHVETWLVTTGLLSLGVAAFLLLQTHDYKRLFAFSTIENMGIILIAVGIGTAASTSGAAWQIVTHAVTKSFCFYAAGATLAISGTRLIAESGALLDRSRFAASMLYIGAFAIAGAPPFSLFLSELAIARSGIAAAHDGVILLTLFFIAVAFFGVLGRIMRVILGSPRPRQKGNERTHALMWPSQAALVIACVPVVVLGVWVPSPLATLFALASQVLTR
jgi:hydrogenase-4 component F